MSAFRLPKLKKKRSALLINRNRIRKRRLFKPARHILVQILDNPALRIVVINFHFLEARLSGVVDNLKNYIPLTD